MPETSEWSHQYETFFWSARAPIDVKFEIEKASTRLLERDPQQTSQLVFRNSSKVPPNQYELQLRFEAAMRQRNLYSLRLNATAPREWVSESSFRSSADRAFAYWIRDLQATPYPGSLDYASHPLYDQFVKQTLERESELTKQKEDQAPIRALQQAVLKGLRDGKSFRESSHEGVMRIYFNGRRYVREEDGLAPSHETFDTDDEMLVMLRNYFDYQAGAETRPYKPAEAKVWRFIQSQLLD